MAITASKPAINIREKLSELDQPQGIKGTEVLRADTADEARNAIGARGRKNLLINGGFDVWQRGTSGSTTGNPHYPSADRWATINYTSGWGLTTNTVGKTTIDDMNVFTFTGNSTDAEKSYLTQRVENILILKGKTVTLSFFAKISSGTIVCDGRIETGGGNNYYAGTNAIIDTTWKKHVVTTEVGTDYTGVGGNSTFSVAMILNQMDLTGRTFYVAQVQLELGDQATEFEHRSYGEELALCQRYYERWSKSPGSDRHLMGGGWGGVLIGQMLVKKRTDASISFSNAEIRDDINIDRIITSSTCGETHFNLYSSGSSFKTGNLRLLTNGYIDFDAEL
jgi:hypothetical protein